MTLAGIIILSALAFIGIMFIIEWAAALLFLPQLKRSVLLVPLNGAKEICEEMLGILRTHAPGKLVAVNYPPDETAHEELVRAGVCDGVISEQQLPDLLKPST